MAEVFSKSDAREILAFVREVIHMELAGAESPAVPPLPILRENGACFVTLKDITGELRGCIGNLEAFEPLGENLRRNALNAAFQDPRFPPLDYEEFNEISIEVSILTKPHRIASLADFELGRDGIIIRCAGRSAVFLPQVAVEQQWDVPTTLMYLCHKAGLDKDAWKSSDAEFYTFQAHVLG